MEYKKKIEYAKRIAEQLQGGKTTEEIKEGLKSEGLYKPDIQEIMVSARKVLENKYLPKIREYLLENKEIKGDEEFRVLDDDTIDGLITTETQNLASIERKKITNLVKEGISGEEILKQVDTRFLPLDKAVEQITRLLEAKKQNSGSGRMINIFGGTGLIVLTGIIFFASGRLFYVLPIIGLYMIIRGFMTHETQYDN